MLRYAELEREPLVWFERRTGVSYNRVFLLLSLMLSDIDINIRLYVPLTSAERAESPNGFPPIRSQC